MTDYLAALYQQGQDLFSRGIPTVPAPPPGFSNLCSQYQGVVTWIAPLNSWMPWDALAAALLAWLAALVAGTAIKFARIVLSLGTGGGGAS